MNSITPIASLASTAGDLLEGEPTHKWGLNGYGCSSFHTRPYWVLDTASTATTTHRHRYCPNRMLISSKRPMANSEVAGEYSTSVSP